MESSDPGDRGSSYWLWPPWKVKQMVDLFTTQRYISENVSLLTEHLVIMMGNACETTTVLTGHSPLPLAIVWVQVLMDSMSVNKQGTWVRREYISFSCLTTWCNPQSQHPFLMEWQSLDCRGKWTTRKLKITFSNLRPACRFAFADPYHWYYHAGLHCWFGPSMRAALDKIISFSHALARECQSFYIFALEALCQVSPKKIPSLKCSRLCSKCLNCLLKGLVMTKLFHLLQSVMLNSTRCSCSKP